MTCSNSLDKKLLKVIKEENFKDFDWSNIYLRTKTKNIYEKRGETFQEKYLGYFWKRKKKLSENDSLLNYNCLIKLIVEA